MRSDFFNSAKSAVIPGNVDEETFGAIYREYWLRLYDFALAKVHDPDVAEEIVQDLFVHLWEKRGNLSVNNLSGYLFVAVRNRVMDHYKQRLFSDLEAVGHVTAPDYPLFLDELENELDQAVGRLPGKTREIFMLNRLEGQSVGEISQKLNLPRRTVEYHITQAIRQLKVFLRSVSTILSLLLASVII